MPRPIKGRRVGYIPEVTYFKPTGIPMHLVETVSLSMEELEAIRLKDQDGLQQAECARLMGVSRPTFHRVLGAARSKIADALTNGKAIRIEGGNFEMALRRFRCGRDGRECETPPGEAHDEVPQVCPNCRRWNVERMSGASEEKKNPSECPRGHRWRKKRCADTVNDSSPLNNQQGESK